MLQKLRAIILTILGLSLIIVVHESGHFLMCKLFDVQTPVFSVGFGPALVQYTYHDTTFQLAALPLGGYVAIDPASLATKTYLQKLIINIAGIAFNIIFALLLIIYLIWVTNRSSLLISIVAGLQMTGDLIKKMLRAMFGIWRSQERAQIMGPIGIISSTTQEQSSNVPFMISWLALINLNVAIFNLLPIPLLDGGHIAIDTIEALYGKPIPPHLMGIINLIFLLLFLAFLFFVSAQDVRRLQKKEE